MPYPFDPYRPLGLPAPKFAEPLDPFAPVPGLPPPPALPDYSNWTPPQPAAPAKPEPAGAWQTLKDIGGGVVETFRGIPAVVASMAEGVGNPHAERDWKDRLIEEGRQRQQADLQTLRDSGEYDRPMGLGMPFTRGEWAETTQSFPYTAATMGPAIAGGAAGGAIGGAIGGLGGPAAPATVPAGVAAGRAIGGTLGGMLGSYLPAGGAAANQFIRESLDRYRQDFAAKSGREPTPEEIDAHYKATVEPQASRVYHGEAAPEAAGTVAELGLMKSAIGDVLHGGGSLPVRIAKAGAKTALSAFGVEPATETITQQIQQPAYAATGLTDEAPRSLKSPEDWLKSAGEVYKQAAATSLFFSALGIPAGAMYGKYRQRQEGNARADSATQATADLRANLDFAREQDIAEALAGLDTVEAQGKVPKRAAERLAVARQQLTDELALRASPAALDAPMDNARGAAGYLGFADRPHELSDDQIFDLVSRPLPDDAPDEWQEARIKYGIEALRRQDLNEAAAHFEENPEAVAGVAKVLGDIAAGKPLAKGAHGSTDYNLASLSDDELTRYRMAGEVLLRDRSEALGKARAGVEKSLELLHQENDRRNSGERRDPQAIREADVAQRVAKGAKGSAKLLDGLSPDALERMAAGLESRAILEPGLADTARQIRERAQRERDRMAGQQAAEQPAPQPQTDHSADRARLAELAQSADLKNRQRVILEREAQRRQQAEPPAPSGLPAPPSLGVPLGAPTVASAAIPQPLGQLGRSRLGIGEDRLPVPASPAVNEPAPALPALPAPPSARAPAWTDPERPALPPFNPLPAPEISPDARTRPVGQSQPVPGTAETAQAKPPVALPARPEGARGARAESSGATPGLWTAFSPESGTLGIPRSEMPQIKAEHRGALVNFMKARGIGHRAAEMSPRDLKPTQAEFSPEKVDKALAHEGGERSILVSRDNRVLDGHHQWLAALRGNKPIPVIRLNAPIKRLIKEAHEFPSSTTSEASTVRGGHTGQETSPTPAAQPRPETPDEKGQAEAETAPLLDRGASPAEAESPAPEKKKSAKTPKAPAPSPTGTAPMPAPAPEEKFSLPTVMAWRTRQKAIGTAKLLDELAGRVVSERLFIGELHVVMQPFDYNEGMVADALKKAGATPEQLDKFGYEDAAQMPAPSPSESPASETPDTTAPEKLPSPVESQRETADKKADIAEVPGGKTAGSLALADSIKAFLLETPDAQLNIGRLWHMANRAFNGSQAQGAYSSKDAYDAMELGLNMAVLESEDAPLHGTDADQVRAAIGYLENLQGRLPTQTKRDDEQQRMQQFSTPHTHAHIVAWAAGIGKSDVVLEPTAGTGNLVAHAKLMGPSEIVANELSERRDALLRQIPGVRVFNENANHLNAVLPADVKPTVVVMNPPFSADVNLPGKKSLDVGATHIEQALARLQPGGRLVAIVGRGMALDAPRFKAWWDAIAGRYNVRANIGISGKEYAKFGTSFDNRILVIDKTGKTESRSNIVTGEVSRVEGLVARLEGVRRERVDAVERNPAGAAGQARVERPESQPETGSAVPAATGEEGAGRSEAVPGVGARAGRSAGRAGPSGRDARAGARSAGARAGVGTGRGVSETGAGPDAGGVDSGPGLQAENRAERAGRPAQEERELEREEGATGPTDAEGFGASAFESYRPTATFKGAKPHPTPLSESAAMGSVHFPPLSYSPKLPADVVREGRLSGAQLETVAYAGQAHEQMLPNGERRGFFIGDGTGVGKGAQIAGILLDNWNRGRKKAVWISENARLFADAQRDAEWVGLGKDRLLLQGKIKGDIGAKEGVLFTTYSTLTSAEQDKDGKPGAKRIDQVIDWLGKDFDGVIAFDEAHNMANALSIKKSRGVAKPSQTALTGIELQKALPNARVVYVSATGATEVRNLVYAARLGLWGEGSAFGGPLDFVGGIESGGLAAMEVVAKDLKAMGAYTARSLSYDGVEVEQLSHPLSPEQAKTYDELARAWQVTLKNVDEAMKASGSKSDAQARSSALSAFWGAHQRFFNAVLTALSAPSLLADAKRQLDAGHSVIMQLVNTDEATMKRRLAQASDTGQALEELDLTPRDVLMQYLQHSFPTTLYEKYIDDEGNERSRPVVDKSGNVVQDPAAVERRDDLIESIATLPVPESVLDQIVNHFGSDAVAEITGRSRRIVRQKDGTAKMEKMGEAKRRADAADFDSGKRRVLVFSDAGGTGRSYHADLRIPNRQKRVHYLVQPGWRADKAIQGLGRSHRTNQAQPPLFKTVTTTIKSQARFVSSIARRMNQMGALTKGQRDASSSQGMFDDDMNLEDAYSKQALTALFFAIAHGRVNGITVADVERQMGIRFIDEKTGQILQEKIPSIQQFLNRLLSLEIPAMDRMFEEFDARRRNNIEYAKQNGFYDAGMETLRALAIEKNEDTVAMTHSGGSTTRYIKLTATHNTKLIPFDGLAPGAVFAKNKTSGKLYAFEPATSVTNPATGEIVERVRRVSPNSVRYMSAREAENRDKYDRLDLSDAQKKAEWAKETETVPKTYDETLHMIAGALLPVWDRLPNGGSTRVIRVQTDAKERLIGRLIEQADLRDTLSRLGVSRDAPKLDGRQAIAAILGDSATIELANGWKLVKRTVNGQPRIEILQIASMAERSMLIDMGAFSEIINWQSRVFLPADNADILDRIFKYKPIVDLVMPSRRQSRPSSTATAQPVTVAQARAQLVSALGERNVAAFERAGGLKIHESDPTKTGAAGFVDGKGVIHLIPGNMDQDALSVALHEGMHLAKDDRFAEGDRAKVRLAHAVMRIGGLKNFIGNPGFSDLVQQVYRMAAEGNPVAVEALNKAKLEGRADPRVDVAQEAVAYLAEYADQRLPLVRRVLAAIRAALYRMGVKVNLTPADVRALALSALKARAKGARTTVETRAVPAYSLPDFAPTAADRAEVERQMKAVKEVRDAEGRLLAPNGKPSKLNERQWKQVRTKFFKDWFGDWENDPKNASKVVDANGEPLVVYHGASEEFTEFDPSRVRFLEDDGAFFFSDSKGVADAYADESENGQTMHVFLHIKNPLIIDAKEGSAIEEWDYSDGAIRKKIKEDGNDGAIIRKKSSDSLLVAIYPSQIKSALGNAGTFSNRSDRIDYSQPTSETDAAEQARLWAEFQAVRARFQAKEAMKTPFRRWFGHGTEGVTARDGNPLTLYHGTNNPAFHRWDASRAGQSSTHPTAGLGFFMTADKRAAARYGARLLELHAKIDKPYHLTDADLWAIDSVEAATRLRAKLMAKGYDGAVIAAPGSSPYVVVFESKQAKYTSNEEPTDSEDFRYSRPGRPPRMDSPRVAAKVLGDIGELRDALRPGEKAKAKLDPRNWAQGLSDLKSDTRPAWLGLLSQDMLIQLAEKQLPAAEVRKFDDASEKMDAQENKVIQAEAFPLAERWQNLMTKDRQQADAMSRLIYMSTWWGVDPRQSAPDGKRAEWIRAKAVHDAMGAEAKKLYGDVLAFYEKQTERLFAELAARIERHALPEPDKLAAKDMLRQEFERMKKEGPYAPLMRFGDLTVWAEPRDKSDKPVFAAFESVAEQRAFADWLKGEGYRPRLGVKMDEIAKRALPQGDFVGKLAGIIDKTAKGPEAQILKDAMYQLFLRSLPEQAIRKHFIHRKFVPGYSSDALRTFATFARRSAKQTARLAHADRMSDALDKMAAAVRSGAVADPVAAGHLVNELDKSYQWAMNPTTATWASRLTHLGFLWHLGASPAHLLLNLSQQAQVTAPWLAGELVGKKGFGAVASALLKANKDFLAGNPFAAPEKRGPAASAARQKLEAEHGGDLGRALKALEEAGKTDKTQTYSIAGLSEEDNFLWTRPWTRKITQGAAWFFHVAEVINREASAIAAYRLGRDAGMDHEAAYDLARRAINDTHFDYAPSNRARIMRGNVAKVLTLFKQYSLNITWQLGRNAYLAARGASKREKAVARTKLLGMLGMTFVMAGAVGMPFYGEVMWLMTQLLNATRDDDEPEWDADTAFRAVLDRALSPTGEQAVRRGLVNAFLGVDLSSRVKFDDLWWRDADSDLQGKQAAYHALEQGLGPVAGLAVRGFATANDAIDALLSGTNARGATWRALEGAMPKAIKDISKGLRFQTDGATTYEGARILEPGELGSAASVGQLMGFTPASLTERYAENRAMTNLQRRIQRQRDALLDSYAMAYRQGDEEVMVALREDMAAFGERYPGKRITDTTLRQSLEARERRREEIERYGGVALDKKLAGMLLEGAR